MGVGVFSSGNRSSETKSFGANLQILLMSSGEEEPTQAA